MNLHRVFMQVAIGNQTVCAWSRRRKHYSLIYLLLEPNLEWMNETEKAEWAESTLMKCVIWELKKPPTPWRHTEPHPPWQHRGLQRFLMLLPGSLEWNLPLMQRRGSSADTQGRGLSSDFLLIVHQKMSCLVLAHKCESLDLKTEMQNRLFVMNIKQYHDIE